MKLADMTVKEEGYQTASSCGLCLWLSAEQVEALGFAKAPPAGTPVTLMAKGVITESGESIRIGEDERKVRMTIEITAMGVNAGKMTDAAKALYGEDD